MSTSSSSGSGHTSMGSGWNSRSSVRIPNVVSSTGAVAPRPYQAVYNNRRDRAVVPYIPHQPAHNNNTPPLDEALRPKPVAKYTETRTPDDTDPPRRFSTPPRRKVDKSPWVSSSSTSKVFETISKIGEIPTNMLEAQRLDLCFLLDATRSMQSSIYMVKQSLGEIANGIKAVYPNCAVRVAIVIYRDYDDPMTDGAVCDFTSDFEGSSSKVFKYLSSVLAMGGGDEAKDVFTGLERIITLDWQARNQLEAKNKLLVHITNSPCHGARFHDPSDRISDRYANGDRKNRSITAKLMALRHGSKIDKYFFCHLTSRTKRMVQEFSRVFRNDEESNWIEDEDFTQGNSIQDSVVLLCRSAIKATLAAEFFSNVTAGGGGPSPSTWKILNGRPRMPGCDWGKIVHVQARQYKHEWVLLACARIVQRCILRYPS